MNDFVTKRLLEFIQITSNGSGRICAYVID